MRRPEERWHALDAAEAVAAMRSDALRGLSSDEAAQRLAVFGPNALPEPARRTLAAVLVRQVKSPLIYLLLAAAAVALALGETTDALVILGAVVINAVVGGLQESRAQRSLEALRRLVGRPARVVRDGRERVMVAREVVPGDILLLAAGDAVAADARLLDGAALQASEAPLTGESVPAGKHADPVAADAPLHERLDMVYAGTHVTAGRARALAIATGAATEIGRIDALARGAEEPRTPLERRVARFGRQVIVAAAVLVVAVIAIGLLRGMAFGPIFMIAISLMVGVIPEGLPVAIAIGLAVGVHRMARRRAIVRRLSSVESLGCTTVICADKTGTLTCNEMTVTSIVLPDGIEIEVGGAGYAPEGRIAGGGAALRELLEAGVLCNDSALLAPDAAHAQWRPLGDPTEVALLTAALKGGVQPADVRARHARRAEVPFDARARMMATEHVGEGGPFVIVKGAPEQVLDLCPGDQRVLLDAAGRLSARALRVLAIAAVPGGRIGAAPGFAPLAGRARALGLVGQADPPRPEAAEAVRRCREAGIRPVLVTGDHGATGLAVAAGVGIAAPGGSAIEGGELERLSADELDRRLDSTSVFVRVYPAQKLRIVEAYQRRGEIVAMTGDGVNDAPALARADVGVAMGLAGTDVAKEAARIVITDDDFATIVAAVEEGRVVYRNIKKAVLLLLSNSAAEALLLLLALVLCYPPPLVAVQILWINLVTEGFITANVVMEPAEGDEMRRPPVPPKEPLLSRAMLRRMAILVPAIVAVTLGWFAVRTAAGLPEAQVRAETFTLLAVCDWFNVLNCRSERRSALTMGLSRNPWLLGGLVLGGALQAAVVFWAPLGRAFHTVPIGLDVVAAMVVAGSAILWIEELRKLLARRRPVR